MAKMIFMAVLLVLAVNVAGQTEDRRISDIRAAYDKTNSRIAEAERNFAESDIFLTELVVNRGGTMYPAVGNFKETIRFYYTYGNREVSPYPNRLLKITVSTERSAVRESAEYLFNQSGQLIFAFVNDGEAENRYYFAGGKLIRWQKGMQTSSQISPGRSGVANLLSERAAHLTKIFLASIRS